MQNQIFEEPEAESSASPLSTASFGRNGTSHYTIIEPEDESSPAHTLSQAGTELIVVYEPEDERQSASLSLAVSGDDGSSQTSPSADLSPAFRVINAVRAAAGLNYDSLKLSADGSDVIYGIAGFRLASGDLGRVLMLARNRDAAGFDEVFGPHAQDLLATLNHTDVTQRGIAVGGQRLDGADWQARFRQAANLEAIKNAQHEHAIEAILTAANNVADALGFTDGVSRALLYALAVTEGTPAYSIKLPMRLNLFAKPDQFLAGVRSLGLESAAAFFGTVGLSADHPLDGAAAGRLAQEIRRSDVFPVPTSSELAARLRQTASDSERAMFRQIEQQVGVS